MYKIKPTPKVFLCIVALLWSNRVNQGETTTEKNKSKNVLTLNEEDNEIKTVNSEKYEKIFYI